MTTAAPSALAELLDLLPAGRQWQSWTEQTMRCIADHSEGAGALSTSTAVRLGECDAFCEPAVDAWRRAGLMDVFVPPALGGCADFPMLYRVCAMLASQDLSIAAALGVVALGTLPLRVAGSAQQCARWFKRVHEGDLAGIALTEAAHGSDLAANETVARRVRALSGDTPEYVADDSFTHYELTGTKHTINNGSRAGFLIVMARTTESARAGAMADSTAHSLVVVDMRARHGMSFERRHTHGFRSVDISNVRFDRCLVDRCDLVGKESDGFRIARRTLEISRGGISAFAVGQLFGALHLVKRYARERRLYGGHAIAEFPMVAAMIAEASASVELIAAMSAWAARVSAVAPLSARRVTAAAKCFAPAEAARQIADLALVLGAAGLLRDHPFERFRRDVSILPVFDGTTNIQRVEVLLHLRRAAGRADGAAPDAVAELELAKEIWTRDEFVDVNLMRGDGRLPRTDPRALEAYHDLHPDCGFLVLAASQRAQVRFTEQFMRDRPGMPGPLSTTLAEGRLADAAARTEATLALALRVATAASVPAGRRAALTACLGVLALETLALVEQHAPESVELLTDVADRDALRMGVVRARPVGRCDRLQPN